MAAPDCGSGTQAVAGDRRAEYREQHRAGLETLIGRVLLLATSRSPRASSVATALAGASCLVEDRDHPTAMLASGGRCHSRSASVSRRGASGAGETLPQTQHERTTQPQRAGADDGRHGLLRHDDAASAVVRACPRWCCRSRRTHATINPPADPHEFLNEMWKLVHKASAGRMRERLAGKVPQDLMTEIEVLVSCRNFLAHRYLRTRLAAATGELSLRASPEDLVELMRLQRAFADGS